MIKNKIYNVQTGRKEPIEKMLRLMKDQWIDNGNCGRETIIDLRDALIESLVWKKRVETAASEVIDEYSGPDGVTWSTLERLEKELGE